MHFCILIVTEKFPSNEVLDEILEPYNEETFYHQLEYKEGHENDEYPQFLWDYWRVGGRYCAKIRLRIDKDNEEYEWEFIKKGGRVGKLFRSMLLEECIEKKVIFFEEDYYAYLGYSDGYLRVDGAKIKDIINFDDLAINHNWGFIGKDGKAYSRSYWNGKEFIYDDQYEEKVEDAIKDVGDCYACIVDIHD